MSEKFEPSWVDKQIREGVTELKESTDLKKDLEGLQISIVIDFLKANNKVLFSQSEGGAPKNSAAIVAMLQRAMNLLELPIKIDGLMTMGGETTQAIAKFQKKYLGGGNGVPGPRTIAKIVEELEKKRGGNAAVPQAGQRAEVEKGPETTGANPEFTKALGTVDTLRKKVVTDRSADTLLGTNPNKTFASGSKNTVNYAQIIEKNAISVWGEVNPNDNSRPLIILDKSGKNVLYVGKLDPQNTLTSVAGEFPPNLNKADYKYQPSLNLIQVSPAK